MSIIATPLGWIMKGCYFVCKNYGIALLLFTILTRLITFPLQIKQQKSTARMAMLTPELDKLKKKYAKNQQKLQEEQMALYAKAGVNPMASCLPMVITMVILFALIPVIYGPLTYVSSINKNDVNASNAMISHLYTVSAEIDENDESIEKLLAKYEADNKDPYEQLSSDLLDSEKYPNSAKAFDGDKSAVSNVVEAIKLHSDIDTFVTNEKYFSKNLITSRPELMTFVFSEEEGGQYSDVLSVVSSEIEDYSKDFNYDLFGIYMGTIPTLKSVTVIIPVLCFILQLLTTVVSQQFAKKNNPAMASMGGSMKVMMYVMPLFSLWIAFSYPLGLGLYWCYSSLIALGQTVVLNKIYTPEHVAELVEKDIAKQKTSGKKNLMQKMAEAQMVQQGKDPAEVRKQLMAEDGVEDYEEPKKKSKTVMKDEQRQKLNEARRRMAEKYGEEYDDNSQD